MEQQSKTFEASVGRLEQIVLKEENQAFLDIAVSLTESGADGETAYGILSALLGE